MFKRKAQRAVDPLQMCVLDPLCDTMGLVALIVTALIFTRWLGTGRLHRDIKIRVYDVRVVRPPHYDTFAEFHYSYHYGDSYIPHLQQEEPLNLACRHFIDCIETNSHPITGGRHGLEIDYGPRRRFGFS